MEPGTDPVLEDRAVLGKRKRSPRDGQPELETGSRPFTSPSTQDVLPVAPDSDPKKLCLRPYISIAKDPEDPHTYAQTIDTLPVEILQHMLTFLDPHTLGLLMRVNRKFRGLLDPRHPLPKSSSSSSSHRVSLLSKDALWKASRIAFLSESPDPLDTMTEYDMMRLVHGRRCQFCGCPPKPRPSLIATSPWNTGPGPHGVRAIWPFKIRSCGECLNTRIQKEQELILSKSSAMQPGLPSACFTPSLHYVATVTLRRSKVPANLQLTKYYFTPQVDDLQRRADQMKLVSPDDFSLWYRGLEPSLQNFMSSVTRLELWEKKSGETALPENIRLGTSSVSSFSTRSGFQAPSVAPSTMTATTHTIRHHRNVSPTIARSQGPHQLGITPLSHPQQVQAMSLSKGHPTNTHSHKSVDRTLQEVAQARHARQTEIERRAQQIEPPILPTDLAGMKAFYAAMQIPRPLDDSDWETLRDRLIHERQQQQVGLSHDQISASSWFPRTETFFDESSRIEQDRASIPLPLESALRLTRDKVSDIGLAYVKRCWTEGTNITEDTAPQFAVDVLQYVAQQFYQIQDQEDAQLSLQGQAPPAESDNGMRTRVLQLRHMKHVFEQCVKPYTDLVLKDLFLCSACEMPEKHYAFNALIQHYAAKHTSAFSRDTHVVYWSSEWPHRNPPYQLQPGKIELARSGQDTSLDLRHRERVASWSRDVGSLETLPAHDSELRMRLDSISQPGRLYQAQQFQSNRPAAPVTQQHDPLYAHIQPRTTATMVGHSVLHEDTPLNRHSREVHGPEDGRYGAERIINRGSMPVYSAGEHIHISQARGFDPRLASRSTHLPDSPSIQDRDSPRRQQNYDTASVRAEAEQPLNPKRSNDRSVLEFLENFEFLTEMNSSGKSDTAMSRPTSRNVRTSVGAAMDRRSNISQPRRPSHGDGYGLQWRESFETRSDFMDVDLPAHQNPTAYRTTVSQPRTQDDRMQHIQSTYSHMSNSPYRQENPVDRSASRRYIDRTQDHDFYDPSWQRSRYAVADIPSGHLSHETELAERNSHQSQYRDPRDRYYAPPPPQATWERYWDNRTQGWVVVEREYVPLSPERYEMNATYDPEPVYRSGTDPGEIATPYRMPSHVTDPRFATYRPGSSQQDWERRR